MIVLSFDNSYFRYYNVKNRLATNICPNVYYVACTRALEHLIVIHGHNNDLFPFLKTTDDLDVSETDDNFISKRVKKDEPSCNKMKRMAPLLNTYCELIADISPKTTKEKNKECIKRITGIKMH